MFDKRLPQKQLSKEFVSVQIEKMLENKITFKDIAMAKNVACKSADYVIDQAVQIHGGMVYERICC